MRRNSGRRGNNSNGGSGAGPLMTGHLQDIDLELELLKRKREMIEQQQQLLVMEQQFKSSRHSFDQMRYDEPDSNRDFTHLYETGPKHRSQFGRKRQAENQWQYDSAPKRSSSKKKSQFNQQGSGNPGSGNFRNQRPNQGQGPKSAPKQPAPLMEIKVKPSIGQKIANQKAQPKAPRKDFAPSKVAKPKAPPAPNKMASHTLTERKSLVAAATAASSDGDMSRMLLPDRVPSQQVSGRLELALGAIMKNIRGLIEGQPQHAATLRSIQLQRVMKQAVRERIRTVMLGKVVGSLIEILAIYREEFPEETDADVLNIALEASGLSAPDQTMKTKFIESGDPGEFFKANLSKLLDTTLNEMFSKLEDIYGNASTIDSAATEGQIDLQKKSDENGKDEQNEYKAFLNTTLKVYDVKRILPRLMKKYVPYVVKLLNLDVMYQTTKAAITMKANEKAAQIFGTTGEEGQGDDQTTAPALQTSKENRYNLPYYVKIMGKPTLPKRKVMQGFLSQFNPKSIKKHRTIHNLLFIGFTEKSDFDVMVGADGTVIGRSTLSVRICSKGGPRESNGETDESNDINQEAIKEENQNEDQIVPIDLEGQITDLLLAIRSEDEEARKENAEETKINGGEEKSQDVKEQAENNSDQVKMEVSEGDFINGEDWNENSENIGNEENKDEIIDENKDEIIDENKDEIIDENKDEIIDENTASQEKDASNKVETQHLEAANESEAQDTEATDEIKTESSEVPKETEKPESIEISDNSNKDDNSQTEIQIDTDKASETAESTKTDEQSDDKVGDLKSSVTGRSTPSRMSARLANVTPSTIRTRRASRLASQN